jgi:hypothetical protein
MRAAPVFQISLHHFGVWRFAIYFLSVLSNLVFATWLWMHEAFAQPLAWGVFVLMMVLTGLLARTLLHNPALGLRWDGQAWHVGQWPAASDSWTPGSMQVMLDLGFWMLLRFTPSAWAPDAAPQWLPVQRLGLEAQWHGLRCSLYSPTESAT